MNFAQYRPTVAIGAVCLIAGILLGRHFNAATTITTTSTKSTDTSTSTSITNTDNKKDVDTEVERGPTTKQITLIRKDGSVSEKETIITGPVQIKTNTDSITQVNTQTTNTSSQTSQSTTITVPPKNWSLGLAGVYTAGDLLTGNFTAIAPQVEFGRRLLGDTWIYTNTTVRPTDLKNSDIGLGLRVEF